MSAGMGYTFQASQYMNGYHFHIKSISMGYLFHPKSIWMGKIWKIVYEWGQFSENSIWMGSNTPKRQRICTAHDSSNFPDVYIGKIPWGSGTYSRTSVPKIMASDLLSRWWLENQLTSRVKLTCPCLGKPRHGLQLTFDISKRVSVMISVTTGTYRGRWAIESSSIV